MDSLPEDQPRPKALAPDTKKRIQQIKNGLVLQVARRRGSFWDEVHEIRAHWDIEARTQLPPEDRNLLYPPQILQIHRGEANLTGQYIEDLHRWEREHIRGLSLSLAKIGQERYRLDLDWWPFMAALVLYQPPGETLREFADYGGIVRKDPYAEYGKTLQDNPEFRRKEAATNYDPMLTKPLIATYPNPYSYGRAWQDYYETLMKEIDERFLKPQGLDIHEMRDEVLKDGTLDESLQERLRQIPQDLYVEIPEHAVVDELREAVGLAHQMQEESKEDVRIIETSEITLIKVELAYRFYQLKQEFKDIPDRKQRYPSIKSSETFKKYASEGRKLLNEHTE
jgi:hypothetical protein